MKLIDETLAKLIETKIEIKNINTCNVENEIILYCEKPDEFLF